MTPATELDNERRIIDRLAVICLVAIVGAVVVAVAVGGDLDTALLVIGTNCVTALGVRRARLSAPTQDTPQPPAAPPLPPELANAWAQAQRPEGT